MIWTPGLPAHGFRLRRGRISLDPNPQLQPAGHINQAPPYNVKRVWTTICYGMACRPLRHNRLAVNPLPVMVWSRADPPLCRLRRRSAWRAERTTGSLVVWDCSVSSVFYAICSCMPLLAQDLIPMCHVFSGRFWRPQRVPLPGCAPSLPVRADWRGRTG